MFVGGWPTTLMGVIVLGIFACAGWLSAFRPEGLQQWQLRYLRQRGFADQHWRTRLVAHEMYSFLVRMSGVIILFCLGIILLALAASALLRAMNIT